MALREVDWDRVGWHLDGVEKKKREHFLNFQLSISFAQAEHLFASVNSYSNKKHRQ